MGVGVRVGVGWGLVAIFGSGEGVGVVWALGSCSTHGIAVDWWCVAVLKLLLSC